MTSKISEWPGVELTSKEFYDGKVTEVRSRPRTAYRFSAGEAMSRFLEELRNGRFIARVCHGCERILFPPRMFCEECFRPTDEWRYILDTGTIETYSASYIDQDAKRISNPILVGVVSLDGASPKMGLMHYFGEMGVEEIRIGKRVKARWRSPQERTGSVLDVRYFAPLREEKQ